MNSSALVGLTAKNPDKKVLEELFGCFSLLFGV